MMEARETRKSQQQGKGSHFSNLEAYEIKSEESTEATHDIK